MCVCVHSSFNRRSPRELIANSVRGGGGARRNWQWLGTILSHWSGYIAIVNGFASPRNSVYALYRMYIACWIYAISLQRTWDFQIFLTLVYSATAAFLMVNRFLIFLGIQLTCFGYKFCKEKTYFLFFSIFKFSDERWIFQFLNSLNFCTIDRHSISRYCLQKI